MSDAYCFTRKDFLDEYTFPLDPTHDFELDGHPAQYASGHPKQWTSRYEVIDFGKELRLDGDLAFESFYTALSPDQKLLAISSSVDRILVYDVGAKELRTTLEGAGQVAFQPVQDTESAGYTLVGSESYDASCGAGPENRLILWDLDHDGRVIDTGRHTRFTDAHLGGFGSCTFSKKGNLLVYHTMNDSTQSGMREAGRLPQVIIHDIEKGEVKHRLSGHTDAIMWSAISPDDQHIGSAAWDGTLHMYSAITGELEWATEPSGGQSWAGAFTPDSKSIIWSSKRGRAIKVLDVFDGTTTSIFPESLDDWCRDFKWHPAGNQVAFCSGKHAFVWRPFDGSDGRIVQHFVLDDCIGWRRMESVSPIGWLQDGRALALQFSDGTNLVYNTETNSKEVFVRPKGVQVAQVENGFYGVSEHADGQDVYLSIDGDGKVSFWRNSMPARPS